MTSKVTFFDGAESSTTPVIGNTPASSLNKYPDDATYEATESGAPATGNLYYNTTTDRIRYYNGTVWQNVDDESSTQTLTNKTIDGGSNTITNVDADNVVVDAIAGLAATDVQAAIAENHGEIETNTTNIGTNTTNIGTNTTDISTNSGDITDIRSATGLADGDTDMGVYSGGIITDNTNQKVINQELSNAIESMPAGLAFQGAWDAATNSPALASGVGTAGHFYQVSVDGSTNLDGITDWVVGDWAVFLDTGVWQKIDNTSQVTSVNGQSGIVLLDSDDVAEGSTNLYNKTHTGDVTGSEALTLQGAAISGKTTEVPEDGDFVLFSDTSDSGNLKKVDIAEVLGGGSGAGGINYITNPDFEKNADDWVTYDDSAAIPVDGTGGSPADLTIATTSTASEILRGVSSLKISKAAVDAQGQGVSTDFTIDPRDKGRDLLVQLDHKSLDSNYSGGDLIVYVYDVDAAQMIGRVLNDQSGELQANTSDGSTFQGVISLTDSLNYRLIFHVATTNAAAWDVTVDFVRVGPEKNVPVSIITNAQSFTPTNQAFGSITSNQSSWHRVGEYMLLDVKFNTGTVTGDQARIDLPDGYIVSNDSPTLAIVGQVERGTVTGNQNVVQATGGQGYLTFGQKNTNGSFVPLAANAQFGSANTVSFQARVKIEGWGPGSIVSTTENIFKTVDIRGEGNASTSITANVTNIDFTETSDSSNSWSGSVYTSSKKEKIRMTGVVLSTTAQTATLYAYVNGVQSKPIGNFPAATSIYQVNCEIQLEKGDQLSFRSDTGFVLGNSAGHYISLSSVEDTSVYGVTGISETVTNELAANFTASSPAVGVWQQPNSAFSITLTPGEYDLNLQGLFGSLTNTSVIGDQITGDIAFSTSSTAGIDQLKTITTHHFCYTGNNISYTNINFTQHGYVVTDTVTIYVHIRWRAFSGSPTISSLGFRAESGSGNGTDPILTATRKK